jgi:ATP-dependent Lon protease
MQIMDIDQHGDVVGGDNTEGKQIILPSEVLPAHIYVLPQQHRPFFPGQAIPLVMNAEVWMPTLKAIRDREQDVVGLIATRHDVDDVPGPADLYDMGTVCRIHRIHREGDQLQVLLEGLQRFRVRNWLRSSAPLLVNVQYFPQRGETRSEEQKAYAVAIINIIKELIPLNPLYGEELKVFLARSNPNEPSLLADFAASLTTAGKTDLQDVLETIPVQRRLEKVVELLHKEVQIAQAQMDIRKHVEAEIQGHQRQAFLRQQLKFIQQELGLSKDDKTAEIDEFKGRLEGRTVPQAAQRKIDEELKKLSLLELGSPEYAVTRNYLDWLTSVPWGVYTEDAGDLKAAARVLDRHHEGLEDIKRRILEFLALGIMKGDVAGSIICLVGPPGVGKTSLGRSVAEALGRRFYRFSVGGMRDEAEIKGHRRTYIGAMPGKLVQALKDTESSNPVIMLDEIDKIGASFQGDPASALLEVLDPEQNGSFHDHYLDVDLDLSKVLFVCTANQLDTIPGPLLDRMEVIHLSGYLDQEKLAIARRHLLPRLLRRAGLRQRGDLRIEAAALRRIVEGYSREAGVRRLEKALAGLVRKAVVRLLEGTPRPIVVRGGDLESYLGKPPYSKEPLQRGVGIVTGLAWTALGGATLPVEATLVHRKQAGLKLTGQLGSVMQESANIAYSFVRAHAADFGTAADFFDEAFVHLHVPAGATPKDGPSAGVTMASALVSLARGRPPRAGFAMTGELTLTGRVYPVGGIREKLLAAKRQNIRKVILPAANRPDYEEVPAHIRRGIDVHFVDTYDEVFALIA